MKVNTTIELERSEVLEALNNYIRSKSLYRRDVISHHQAMDMGTGAKGIVVVWGEAEPEPEVAQVPITHKTTETPTTVS